MTAHRLKAYLYLILVAIIWGAAGPVIKFTLGGIDPLPFLAYRFTVSAFFSLIYFLTTGIKIPHPKTSLPFALSYGLLAFTISLFALFYGLDQSTVLDLTLINIIGPLIVTLGGALFFHDQITKKERLGIAIVLTGAAINIFAPLVMNHSSRHLTGNLFIITFLLADSSSTLLAKKIVRNKIPAIILTNLGFIVGAATIIPFAIFNHGFPEVINQIITLPFPYHLGVWYMALFSGTLAYFLFVKGQKSIEVSEAILFSYLQPLFSIPLAVLWLKESITPTFILGAFLIIIGIIIAELKNFKF